METILLDDFLDNGIIKEKSFRAMIDKIDFKDKYSGFSDHTIGMNAPLIAVARGARILEKHFTLSKKMHGPDHQGSMEPNELRQLVKSAREFEEFMSK